MRVGVKGGPIGENRQTSKPSNSRKSSEGPPGGVPGGSEGVPAHSGMESVEVGDRVQQERRKGLRAAPGSSPQPSGMEPREGGSRGTYPSRSGSIWRTFFAQKVDQKKCKKLTQKVRSGRATFARFREPVRGRKSTPISPLGPPEPARCINEYNKVHLT